MYKLETKNNNQALALSTTKSNTLDNNVGGLVVKDSKDIALNKVEDSKHFSPANKEWKNSTYAYNKNSIRSISILDKMAGKMIKSYFNLNNNKKIARSKRMRTLIRRSTVKRLFVSKPEIKQSAEKVNITVYTFDREKQFYIRKLYFYNKSLNLYNLWLNKTLSSVNLSTYRPKKGITMVKNMSKRTLNPLYLNSMFTSSTTRKLNLTKRISKNKTYLHKLLPSLKKDDRPFLRALKKHVKIQRKSNVVMYNNIRKNYFSKLFAQKLGLGLRKKRITYKHYMKKPIRKNRLFKRNAIMAKNSKRQGGAKIRIPYFNLKLKNEMKFFFFKLAYVKKFDYLRKLFFFSFMKYALSLFQTKVVIYNKAVSSSVMRNNELILEFSVINPENNNSTTHYKLIKNYSNNKLKLIQRINMELLQFLDLTLVNNNNINTNKEKIYSLYEYFKANYYILFLRKSLKKELLALNYYTKYMINQYKFGKFLPGLKLLISNIYSKKVELNIVNLKYSHLNSDIYTETIATKLRRKVGLLKVLRRSLNLARTPYKFFSVNNAENINNLQGLTTFKSLNMDDLALPSHALNTNVNSKDKMEVILNKIYPNSLVQNFNLKSFIALDSTNSLTNNTEKLNNISAQSTDMLNQKKVGAVAKNVKLLNQIRYKWVTGVRLEAAGRLTRRYTAARSVFKYKYKGNLKNIDYSLKTDVSKKNISTVMLRNNVQPNLQYSFAKSKRRIGAFGIKGWINSY